MKLAAPAVGVSWNTCKEWLSKGRDGLEPYAQFVADVEQAKARWATNMVLSISAASRNDWRAAAYMLERRVPGFYRPDQHAANATPHERVVLLYPVPMPLGAEPQTLVLQPGHAFERRE